MDAINFFKKRQISYGQNGYTGQLHFLLNLYLPVHDRSPQWLYPYPPVTSWTPDDWHNKFPKFSNYLKIENPDPTESSDKSWPIRINFENVPKSKFSWESICKRCKEQLDSDPSLKNDKIIKLIDISDQYFEYKDDKTGEIFLYTDIYLGINTKRVLFNTNFQYPGNNDDNGENDVCVNFSYVVYRRASKSSISGLYYGDGYKYSDCKISYKNNTYIPIAICYGRSFISRGASVDIMSAKTNNTDPNKGIMVLAPYSYTRNYVENNEKVLDDLEFYSYWDYSTVITLKKDNLPAQSQWQNFVGPLTFLGGYGSQSNTVGTISSIQYFVYDDKTWEKSDKWWVEGKGYTVDDKRVDNTCPRGDDDDWYDVSLISIERYKNENNEKTPPKFLGYISGDGEYWNDGW